MYYWQYIIGITRARTAPELRVGAAVHKFLEFWHNGNSYDQALAEMKADFARTLNQIAETPLGDQVEEQLVAQAELLCSDYAKRYPIENEYKFIRTELQDDAPLPEGHTLLFRIDGLVAYENALWVGEHKTTRQLGDWFINSFSHSHQIVIYVYGAAAKLKQALAGAVVNLLRKPSNNTTTAFYRFPVVVTKDHMRNAIHSFGRTATEIEQRDKSSELYWPQVTKECGRCDYVDICWSNLEPTSHVFVKREPDYVDNDSADLLRDEQSDDVQGSKG